MWLWTWAKPLRWWQLALFAVAMFGRLGGPYLADAGRRVPNTWVIPAYSALKTVTGRLARTHYESAAPHSVSRTWGQLVLDDGSLFGFTCKPGVGDPSCAYTPPYDQDPNLGKYFQIRFFDSPDKQGPIHVLMEMRGVGRFSDDVILRVSDSRQRIEDYREEAGRPSFVGVLFWGVLLLMTPGVINRVLTGREVPPDATSKRISLDRI